MNTQESAKLFECLSSPVRLDIFSLLIRYGSEGLVAGQIASELNLPATNLSFHLKTLTYANLVSVQQEGRFLRYRANLALMKALAGFLTNQCCLATPNEDCSTNT
ncbi:ArsR/SmtB family transcription factor [Zophobihabitans entericus]|uniref:Helix-turn-helix transcriptional regulator n=1 Tax=Zophobihabitans entericus TaxID=1635327 RepID=A0A6G9IAZ7_9GAMM|nr:metalloregulator ArsR/SmtB family transcription factor [Zophobihabitans entericus]QIQ21408.1 helix-turn-helix transcriptional regulator [Zophobihabitans entericus]